MSTPEAEKKLREAAARGETAAECIREKLFLEEVWPRVSEELHQLWPRVNEANTLARELKRDFKFDYDVMQSYRGESLVMVQVVNEHTETEWLWEKDKFVNRLYLMRKLYEKYLDGSLDTSIFGGETDPFVDHEAMHVGYSSVFLRALAYCMPQEDDYAIYHDGENTGGIMHIRIEPCWPDGAVIKEDEDDDSPYDDVQEPKDLLGKRLDVLVTITACKGLAKKFSSETYIEFEFPKAVNPNRPDGRWRTGTQTGTINPNFNFVQQITYQSVDDQVLHDLEYKSAFFHVYGLQDAATVHARNPARTRARARANTRAYSQVISLSSTLPHRPRLKPRPNARRSVVVTVSSSTSEFAAQGAPT